MRKLTTYLLAFFWIGLFAQERTNLENPLIEKQIFDKDRIPLVEGKLLNYSPSDAPSLSIKYSFATPTIKKQVTRSAEIASDGSFNIKLDLGIGYQEVWLSVGDLYYGRLLANKDLYIELDLTLLQESPINHIGEGVAFSGTDAKMNMFINEFEIYKSDKRAEIDDEKISIIMSNSFSKLEKEKELKKVYKKQATIEHQFAKKNGKNFEWILANDRIASMYADLFSIHWGKKMSDLLKQECLAFKPSIVSNASIRYYDFIGLYYKIPNRIETKMITERTLRAQLSETTSSANLDQFLREYDKKRDHLQYNAEVYEQGEMLYLDTYEAELEMASLDLQLQKINKLSKEKSALVKLLSQPDNLRLRAIFIEKVKSEDPSSWIISLMTKDLETDIKLVDNLTSVLKQNKDQNNISIGTETHLTDCFIADSISMESLICNIKAMYPEKAIILDFWAPWTSICKDDLTRNKSFSEALDTLPIQMVYLCSSLDVSQKSWEDALASFPESGTHIYLNDQLTAEFMEYFQIKKYPTYFFIDQDGNFDRDLIPSVSQVKPRKLAARVSKSERI
ncbi:thioredoxin family protein [Portibacter lacus]|uniref:thioredoxin family protein n=1 Tax=Portibacter lacus TaxID=1099794 RepID=UPI001F43ECA9|nr:thioredoxin family protein [Portibacter lacus]